MILREPGGERVDALLDAIELGKDVKVAISSVNWCEILTRMQRHNVVLSGERLSALLAGVELVPFGKTDAEVAARYANVNRALSLGDRACLALAESLKATAWTADRFWIQCKLSASVELIRS
jgi:PIN domain nuclease of toxin-antitoxin system